MICGVFGLPRAGKTTFLTYLALEALKGKALHVGHLRWRKPIGEFAPYERVFCNFPLAGTFKLDFDALGVYDFSNSLILIDEIMLVCDSRDWSNFRHDLRDFLALHGHYKCDLVYCSQGYMDTDKRIRNLTERMFYIEKFGGYTRVRPIDKGFTIDDQIKEGYTLGAPLAATYIKRSKYYKYFDSFDAPKMPDNPAEFWSLETVPESWLDRLIAKFKRHVSPESDEEPQNAAEFEQVGSTVKEVTEEDEPESEEVKPAEPMTYQQLAEGKQ